MEIPSTDNADDRFMVWAEAAGAAGVRIAFLLVVIARRSHVVVKGPGAPRATPAPGAALRSGSPASSERRRCRAPSRPTRAAAE